MALCVPVSTSFYNGVPSFPQALSEFREKNAETLIAVLGGIFVKHNVWDKFAVSMNHKHFKIEDGEILVEVQSLDLPKTVALPWAVTDGTAKPCVNEKVFWTEFHLTEQPFIIPRSWAFNKKGTLQPFEFCSSPHDQFPIPSEEFMDDFRALLSAANLDKVIGIRTIDCSSKQDTYETTPDGKRANVTSIGSSGIDRTNMVQVSWRFNAQGFLQNGSEFCGCINNCGSHCNSHSK